MAVPARDLEQRVEVGEEDGVIDGQREGDVAHVARAMHVVETARAAEVLLAARPHGRVVEAALVRVQETVKGGWVGDMLAADPSDLVSVYVRKRTEERRMDGANRGSRPRTSTMMLLLC